MVYIPRTLALDKGGPAHSLISEEDVVDLEGPLVVLGEPGIGKTDLTKSLAARLQAALVPAAVFIKHPDPQSLVGVNSRPLIIIDGLDEVTASSGSTAVQEVLGRLLAIGNPKFVIACRAADWNGANSRHLIKQFYGADAKTLHLEALTKEEGVALLSALHSNIDAKAVLDDLDGRGLADLVGNPLTLKLIGEVAARRAKLPESKVALLDEACTILVQEENAGHQTGPANTTPSDELLLSAGAVSACILLAGARGIWKGPPKDAPTGFLPISKVIGLPDADQAEHVLKTRLFGTAGEDRHIPVHRVIAEFLAAKWLAARLSAGASRRRLTQLLQHGNGVPTNLRGLHAWLAYFYRPLTTEFIARDPYGVLRYAEAASLPLPEAKALLAALTDLAEEDPYFRSEDWSAAGSGLTRPELRDDIVELITAPGRHFHLSSLLLNALPGTALAGMISSDLLRIIKDRTAYYAERERAVKALVQTAVETDWHQVIGKLAEEPGDDAPRLALEIVHRAGEANFEPALTVTTFLKHEGVGETIDDDDDERRSRVSGVAWFLFRSLSPERAALHLDEFSRRLSPRLKGLHWEARSEIRRTVAELISKVATDLEGIEAERFWSWSRLISGDRGHRDELEGAATALAQNPSFRRAVQWAAMTDEEIEGGPGIAMFFHLPQTGLGLSLTDDDTRHFLDGITDRDDLTEFHIDLWAQLVRGVSLDGDHAEQLESSMLLGREKHPPLAEKWAAFNRPPERDWQKEDEARKRRYQRQRRARYARHRKRLAPLIDKMRTAEASGALLNPAGAYLGRFTDTPRDGLPHERLIEWLGGDIASAALEGFVRFLKEQSNLSAREIAEVHAESKEWNSEPLMRAGALEMLRNGESLGDLPEKTRAALLASWWQFPEQNERKAGADLGEVLEDGLFSDATKVEEFLRAVVEPELAADGEHVTGLYRIDRDDRLKSVGTRLAVEWLDAYPGLRARTQNALLNLAMGSSARPQLLAVVDARLHADLSPEDRRLWLGAKFMLQFDEAKSEFAGTAAADPELIWAVRSLVTGDDYATRGLGVLSVGQLQSVVENFGPLWPPVPRPSSGWGNSHAWNAADFVEACIRALGTRPTQEASSALDALATLPGPFSELIRHTRSQQARMRRDAEYEPPPIEEVAAAASNAPPATIDSLKALILDQLDDAHSYIRGGPTDGWEQFWSGATPHPENGCRNRLLDILRPFMPGGVSLHAESLMPELKRADLLVQGSDIALPIEIKRHWHPDLWHAQLTQLDELYTRHWQASGRGIYLVFWFGEGVGPMPAHPDGLPLPTTPHALRQMLEARLTSAERSRIDVVVVDVSRGPQTLLRAARRRPGVA